MPDTPAPQTTVNPWSSSTLTTEFPKSNNIPMNTILIIGIAVFIGLTSLIIIKLVRPINIVYNHYYHYHLADCETIQERCKTKRKV